MKKTTAILSITAALFSLFFTPSCSVDADANKMLYFYANQHKLNSSQGNNHETPETVGNLRIIEGKESAMLLWDNALYEDSVYKISYRKSSDSEDSAVTVEVENPKKYYYKSLYNLENDTEYTFSVVAIEKLSTTTKSLSDEENSNVSASITTETTTDEETGAVTETTTDTDTGIITAIITDAKAGTVTVKTTDTNTGITTEIITDSKHNTITEKTTDKKANKITIVEKRFSKTETVVTTPKEKLAVKAKPSDATTTDTELDNVPEEPTGIWLYMMSPESYEQYLKDGKLDGKTYYTTPGDNSGIIALRDCQSFNSEWLIQNNVGACDRLLISNSSAVKYNLRDGEDVHWFAIKRESYHWAMFGYLYNKKLEDSILSGTVPVEEKTSSDVVWFDTVKDMEECATIYHNSTEDSYNGVTVKTRGYYAVDDGGAATYSTQARETYINKRARPHYYKFLDHRTTTGQIMAYIPGNIDCDVDGDGTAESVPGINIRQLGAGHCTQINDRSENANYTDNDDVARFEDAMNVIYDWYDAHPKERVTIYFPAGEYRMGSSFGPVVSYLNFIGDTDILTSDLSAIDENKIIRTKNSYGWETHARSKDASKRTVLYTDNGGSYGEAQFSIWDCSHFYMRGITMECRKTKRVSHTTERMVYIAGDLQNLTSEDDAIQDITVEGCEIYVDENCHKDDGNLDRQFTSVTVYSGVKNATIKNNLLVNMSGVERGACYGVFDFWGNGDAEKEIGGTEDILLEGNIMYHNCHDESGGIFTTGHPQAQKPECYVHRVTIRGNEMHPMSSNASSRTMCFTMAYGVSFNIRDVLFEDNHVIADFPSKLMTFGHFDTVSDASKTTSDFVDSEGNIYGVVVRNNTFDICQHWNNSYVFEANKYAWIHDNTINIIKGADGNAATCGSIFQGGAAYDNNIVTDEADGTCSAGGLAYMAGRLRNNTVTMHGHIGSIASATFDVRNNTITLNKRLSVMFNNPDVSSDMTISGNTIKYNISAGTPEDDTSMDFIENKDSGWQHTHVLSLGRYGNKENNYPAYTVNFTNNTILAPDASSVNKHVLYSKFPNYDPNNINIKNNKLEKFTWVRSQMGALPQGTLTYSGNVDANGNALEFSMEEGNYKNFIKGAGETNPSE